MKMTSSLRKNLASVLSISLLSVAAATAQSSFSLEQTDQAFPDRCIVIDDDHFVFMRIHDGWVWEIGARKQSSQDSIEDGKARIAPPPAESNASNASDLKSSAPASAEGKGRLVQMD